MQLHHDKIIVGNENIILGDNNTIRGDSCVFKGNNVKVHGSYNVVYGNQCIVEGSYNFVIGDGTTIITGRWNNCYGDVTDTWFNDNHVYVEVSHNTRIILEGFERNLRSKLIRVQPEALSIDETTPSGARSGNVIAGRSPPTAATTTTTTRAESQDVSMNGVNLVPSFHPGTDDNGNQMVNVVSDAPVTATPTILWSHDIHDLIDQMMAAAASSSSSASSSYSHQEPTVPSANKEDKWDEKKEIGKCMLCCENKMTYIAMPCMHAICCSVCYKKLKDQARKCIVCRAQVKEMRRFYM
jgi:hypothetical protein